MERLTNEQRLQIVEIYYQNSCSVKNVHRLLRPYYGRHNRPCESTIRAVITKFRTKFTLLDIKPSTRMRTVRTEENIAAVASSVNENREMSIRRRSQQLGLCYSTTWKILSVDLGLKAYKIQLLQELKPNDLPQRLMFGEWALEQLDENPLFYRKIVFSDEAHFWLNGYVNKQNCRIWSDEQPHAINELPMHPEKTTVWCGLWAGGIIGPFFFKDDRGRNVT
ncbi:Putative DD41D transposase, partial [Caligus rogercresseyi]